MTRISSTPLIGMGNLPSTERASAEVFPPIACSSQQPPVTPITELMDDWICTHRPTKSESKALYVKFLQSCRIYGNEVFVWDVEKTIKKASKLATGATLLRRILSLQKLIEFRFSSENAFCENSYITLTFSQYRVFQLIQNEQGRKELIRVPNVAVLFHELLHKWHYESDPSAFKTRCDTKSPIAYIHNREEELTMLGTFMSSLTEDSAWNQGIRITFPHSLPDAPQGGNSLLNLLPDPCCEMTVLRESRGDFRCSHRGVTIRKGKIPSLDHFIRFRAIENITQALLTGQLYGSRIQNISDPLTTTLALKLITRCPKKEKEYRNITLTLIRGGILSENALNLAILANEAKIIQALVHQQIFISTDILAIARNPNKPLEEIEHIIRQVLDPKITERKRDTAFLILFSKYFGKKRASFHLLSG